MALGGGRVVQLRERDPAGVELGLGIVRAAGQAGVGRRGVGGAVVARAQGRIDHLTAQRPDLAGGVGVGQHGRELGRQLQRHVVQIARHQIAHAVYGQAGIVGQGGGQGRDPGVGVAGLVAQRRARRRQRLLVGRQHSQDVVQRRAGRAIEQGVGALDVVVGRHVGAVAAEHQTLGVGVERLVAPPVLDQRLGVLGAAGLLIGGGQRHGAFRGGRVRALEPGDDLSRRQVRLVERLFGHRLAPGHPGPAGEVAPRLIELEEGQLFAVSVDQRPQGDLAHRGIAHLGHGGLGGGGLAVASGGDGGAEGVQVGAAGGPVGADSRKLHDRGRNGRRNAARGLHVLIGNGVRKNWPGRDGGAGEEQQTAADRQRQNSTLRSPPDKRSCGRHARGHIVRPNRGRKHSGLKSRLFAVSHVPTSLPGRLHGPDHPFSGW